VIIVTPVDVNRYRIVMGSDSVSLRVNGVWLHLSYRACAERETGRVSHTIPRTAVIVGGVER